MNLLRVFVILLLPLAAFADSTVDLSVERQHEIIDWYKWAGGQAGQHPMSASMHSHDEVLKCGFPIVSDFVANHHKLDPAVLKASGVNLFTRPILPESYVSPSGRFRIHYDRTGDSAVYRANVDNNGNGVPDYVDTVAMVLDSVHNFVVDSLGYPAPLSDSFYPEGGDDKFDVYLTNLGGRFYGLTYPDSVFVDNQLITVSTGWMELDNDYQEENFFRYRSRPLDAVRVTAAHEYFHAVHFALDYGEAELRVADNFVMRYWMEMSAVWMEEEMYDDINDYYIYLSVFFNDPNLSLQTFRDASDLHPYASVVFPIYLSTEYGRDAIRDIWFRCRQLGSGPSFFQAVSEFADSVNATTTKSVSFPQIFAEFTVWNFFTGYRSSWAPNNIGYSEKWVYPQYETETMNVVDEYPILVAPSGNPDKPDLNGEAFLIWDQTQAIDLSADNNFEFYLALNRNIPPRLPDPWGIAVLYQLDQVRDSFEVDYIYLPDDSTFRLVVPNPNELRTITLGLSPASRDITVYQSQRRQEYGYLTDEVLDSTLIDTTGGGVLPEPKFVAVPSMFVAPYPNPAVIADMSDPAVRFRVEVKFDSANFIFYQADPLYLAADLYNTAGEYIANVSRYASGVESPITYELAWDMKNGSGEPVASGAYIALVRLYSKERSGVLLAESTAKLLIVR